MAAAAAAMVAGAVGGGVTLVAKLAAMCAALAAAALAGWGCWPGRQRSALGVLYHDMIWMFWMLLMAGWVGMASVVC